MTRSCTIPLALAIGVALAASLAPAQINSAPGHAVASSAPAPGSAPVERGDIRSFTLSPVAPPTPVLKYRFDYEAYERTAGDAAPIYLEAMLVLANTSREQSEATEKAVEELLDLSDAHDTRQYLERGNTLFRTPPAWYDMLRVASRRDTVNWSFPIREQGMATLLPHLNRARTIANYLRVRAEYEALTGKHIEAIDTIRTGILFGRHIGEGGLLVNALVGIGIGAADMNALETVMNTPGSPNLYWALTGLPRPLFDLRNATEHEGLSMLYEVPGVQRYARGEQLAPEDWKRLIDDVAEVASKYGVGGKEPSRAQRQLGTAALLMMTLPDAREYYARTRKLPAEAVEQLDPFEVCGPYMLEPFINMNQRARAYMALPYPQMQARLAELRNEIQGLAKSTDATLPMMLYSMLLPSYERAAETFMRLDRTVAALATVEALRSYAAAHNGQLPATLDAITDTPALPNPRTGQPFTYNVQNGVATLSDNEPKDYPLKYEVRIRR
ncbi:MAG: hypothetical protein QM770_02210 [Tepidisphaeraceae bacterium]